MVLRKFNLPAVVTLVIHRSKTRDGWELEDTMKELEYEGADVVGLNYYRGPNTMLPLLERIIKAVNIPVAAVPVPYRTTEKEPTFMCLTDDKLPSCTVNQRPFPVALDGKMCTRYEIEEFTRKAQILGVKYLRMALPFLNIQMVFVAGICHVILEVWLKH